MGQTRGSGMYDDGEVSLNRPPTDPGDQMLEDSEQQMMQEHDAVFSNRCSSEELNLGSGACFLMFLACRSIPIRVKTGSALYRVLFCAAQRLIVVWMSM